MPTIGLRHKFAIVIGPLDDDRPTMRRVDIYAAGRLLTCDDNVAYVPTFADCLKHQISYLLSERRRQGLAFPDLSVVDNHRKLLAMAKVGDNDVYRTFEFLNWGPTTDNVSANLFVEHGVAFIAFSFWRAKHHVPAELGQVFVAELAASELIGVLLDAAWALATGVA